MVMEAVMRYVTSLVPGLDTKPEDAMRGFHLLSKSIWDEAEG